MDSEYEDCVHREDISGVSVTDEETREPFNHKPAFNIRISSNCIPSSRVIDAASELNLARMQGYFLHLNGYKGQADFRLANIRLVESGTSQYTQLEMDEQVAPFGRKVCITEPVAINTQKLTRDLGPVSALGPVTVVSATGAYACSKGHFGGGGDTYYQNHRRGIVAYDNNRLLVLLKANSATAIAPGMSTTTLLM